MRIHPAADIFPMVPDDGLASLAESIKANGLRFPIVVREVATEDGEFERELIDGRNRLRACEMVGAAPVFTVFEGDDDAVRAFIADVNLERRDLKKGQKAMALAMLFPKPKRGRGNKDEEVTKGAETASFSYRRVQEARQILSHSAELADDVIADRVPLDAALTQVRKEQSERAAQVREEQARRSAIDAKMERLNQQAADLAERVIDERMSLDDAMAALEERERKRLITIQHGRQAVGDLKGVIVHAACIAAAFQAGERVLLREDFEEIHAAFQRLKQLVEAH